MFEQPAFHQHSDAWGVLRGREFVGQPAPTQNPLLAALPVVDYERLLPELEPVPLPLGRTIHESGDREKYLYFPTAGVVCRFYATESGASAGIAITGREGVIGVASFLGGESTLNKAKVLCAGYAYRVRAALLKSEFELPCELLGEDRHAEVARLHALHDAELQPANRLDSLFGGYDLATLGKERGASEQR